MKNSIFLLVIMLVACGTKHDISKVKVGMHSKEVEAFMGPPDDKIIVPVNTEGLKYGSSQLIVIHADTVTNVVPDINNASEEMQKAFNAEDSTLKEVYDATKGIAH